MRYCDWYVIPVGKPRPRGRARACVWYEGNVERISKYKKLALESEGGQHNLISFRIWDTTPIPPLGEHIRSTLGRRFERKDREEITEIILLRLCLWGLSRVIYYGWVP